MRFDAPRHYLVSPRPTVWKGNWRLNGFMSDSALPATTLLRPCERSTKSAPQGSQAYEACRPTDGRPRVCLRCRAIPGENDMSDFDVVVVGAGPVGLTLAIDLGRRGARTLLLEKDPTTKQYPKMDRSNARTMEFYRRLGVADRVRALGYPPDASMDVFIVTRLCDPPLARLHYPSVAEHRAKIAACKDASEPLEPYQLVSQNDLEPVLKEIAESALKVTVRLGGELTDFVQDGEGVSLSVKSPDGAQQTIRASYLVGCDGGKSTVRKTHGIKLEGQGNIRATRQICFRSESFYENIPIGKGRHYYVADKEGSAFVVQGTRKEITLNTALPDGADLEQEVRNRAGFDFDFKLLNV